MSGAIATAVPQHLQALEQANEIRLSNAAVRREIAHSTTVDGFLQLAQLLAQIPELPQHTGRMRLLEALCAVHRVGERRAARMLWQAGIARHRRDCRLAELTLAERDRLVRVIGVARGGDG